MTRFLRQQTAECIRARVGFRRSVPLRWITSLNVPLHTCAWPTASRLLATPATTPVVLSSEPKVSSVAALPPVATPEATPCAVLVPAAAHLAAQWALAHNLCKCVCAGLAAGVGVALAVCAGLRLLRGINAVQTDLVSTCTVAQHKHFLYEAFVLLLYASSAHAGQLRHLYATVTVVLAACSLKACNCLCRRRTYHHKAYIAVLQLPCNIIHSLQS